MPHKKKQKAKSGKTEIKPTALSYNGPIVPKAARKENDVASLNLNFTGLLTSSAGGVIDSSYSNDPSSYALADWTSMTNVWHEYRVLGLRMEFFPHNRYSKTSTVCTPMIVVIDRSASGLLGSYQSAMNHSSARKVSLEDPWHEEAKMSSVDESSFLPCSGPVPNTWIKFYSDGLSVSTAYGRTFVYLLIQFRGRK